LDANLGGRLRQAVGFRNILVHQYVDLDDDRVVSSLDDVADLRAFVAQVADWLASQSTP
jgi:uncharacterized protein YutE (UPF0331/DUF86 family)